MEPVISIVMRAERPEWFVNARPEFMLAASCTCGWRSIEFSEREAQRTAEVHRDRFCSDRSRTKPAPMTTTVSIIGNEIDD